MRNRPFARLLLAACLGWTVAHAAGCADDPGPTPPRPPSPGPDLAGELPLREGWEIRSSDGLEETGATLSTPTFVPQGWHVTAVPSTVLAALVAAGVYADPYFGMNMRSIPGGDYPIGANFSELPMPPDSPFRRPWWYRKVFDLPSAYAARSVFLHLDGVNYRADVWLNGVRIADRDAVAGTYRRFRLEVTDQIRPGRANALAVEVYPPQVTDLAINWVDWNPLPPDKNMGLWHGVYLTTSGPVDVRHPQVVTELDTPSLDRARLTVTAELVNTTNEPVTGTLEGRVEDVLFSQSVDLSPGETRLATFSPDRFPQLAIAQPRLWWPVDLGPQHLHDLDLRFTIGRSTSDRASLRFGIRQVTSEPNEHGHRVFRVNGKRVLVKGAGWAPDMMLRWSAERDEAELAYVRDLHLNAVRLEGKLGTDAFLDLCDRYGILVIAGWCCCAQWERWSRWDEEDYRVAPLCVRDQVLRLRNHPCMLTWLNGSDFPPPPEVERAYIHMLEAYRWPNPYQSSASEEPTPVSGQTGLKMTGPYEYVPPIYWYADTENGGAFGFNTETGPGLAIPQLETLRRMLPEDLLWPINEVWDYHGGGGLFAFTRTSIFTSALENRYGAASGLEDYLRKAQAVTYETQRAMFEAYRANKYRSTGVIQWMLNDAWPSLLWHLYDHDLRPGGGYYGTKKANEPLHIQYAYDTRSVVVVNARGKASPGMRARATVYNLDATEMHSQEATVDVEPDGSQTLFTLPRIRGLTTTHFLHLRLEDPAGHAVSTNRYWLSTRPDVVAWGLASWFFTPTLVHADFRALQGLPEVALDVSARAKAGEHGPAVLVALENAGTSMAFLVRLRLWRARTGEEVLPVLWEDNSLTLLPGERREISASLPTAEVPGTRWDVGVDGWNVTPGIVPVQPADELM